MLTLQSTSRIRHLTPNEEKQNAPARNKTGKLVQLDDAGLGRLEDLGRRDREHAIWMRQPGEDQCRGQRDLKRRTAGMLLAGGNGSFEPINAGMNALVAIDNRFLMVYYSISRLSVLRFLERLCVRSSSLLGRQKVGWR